MPFGAWGFKSPLRHALTHTRWNRRDRDEIRGRPVRERDPEIDVDAGAQLRVCSYRVKNLHSTPRIWQYQTDRNPQVNALRNASWTPLIGLTRKGSEVQILYRPRRNAHTRRDGSAEAAGNVPSRARAAPKTREMCGLFDR